MSYRHILIAPYFVLRVHFGFRFDKQFRHFVETELDHMTKRCHPVLRKKGGEHENNDVNAYDKWDGRDDGDTTHTKLRVHS